MVIAQGSGQSYNDYLYVLKGGGGRISCLHLCPSLPHGHYLSRSLFLLVPSTKKQERVNGVPNDSLRFCVEFVSQCQLSCF